MNSTSNMQVLWMHHGTILPPLESWDTEHCLLNPSAQKAWNGRVQLYLPFARWNYRTLHILPRLIPRGQIWVTAVWALRSLVRWWMHLIHRKHQNAVFDFGLPMAAYGCLDGQMMTAFHDMFHERPSATAGRPRLHGAMKPWSLDANRIDENNRYSMIQHDTAWYMNDIWMIQITSDNPGISMVSSGTERRFNLL